MKVRSWINRIVNKTETEAYCMVYIRYRKLILDFLVFVLLLIPLVFKSRGMSYFFLMAAFVVALFRLEQTFFEIAKDKKLKHRKKLTEQSAIEEVKQIINERH